MNQQPPPQKHHANDNNHDKRPNHKQTSYDEFMSANPTSTHLSHHSSQPNQSRQPAPYHSPDGADLADLVKLNHLTYLLYVLSYFTAGLLWIVPIVINYLKRDQAKGTWLATHFDWQIKTFWYGLIYGAVGIVLMMVSFVGGFASIFAESVGGGVSSGLLFIAGLVLLGFSVLWHLYRIVRGWIALSNNRAVP